MSRKIKRVAETMFDAAFEVELESLKTEKTPYMTDIAVYLNGEKIGYLTEHHTQSERSIPGSRLVSRGSMFKAWAQRSISYDRFDYYAQHRSQSEAIRALVRDVAPRTLHKVYGR